MQVTEIEILIALLKKEFGNAWKDVFIKMVSANLILHS